MPLRRLVGSVGHDKDAGEQVGQRVLGREADGQTGDADHLTRAEAGQLHRLDSVVARQHDPQLAGESHAVTVMTSVTNNGPSWPTDATLELASEADPEGSITPASAAEPVDEDDDRPAAGPGRRCWSSGSLRCRCTARTTAARPCRR